MINLSHFRQILGNVNDGDAYINQQGQLEKVNHGNFLKRWFGVCKTVNFAKPRHAQDARLVWRTFADAIVNSDEFRRLSPGKQEELKGKIAGKVHASLEQFSAKTTALKRCEIRAVIDLIDEMDTAELRKGGLYGKTPVGSEVIKALSDAIDKSPVCNDPVVGARLFAARQDARKGPAEVERFIRANQALLKKMVFDRQYSTAHLKLDDIARDGYAAAFSPGDVAKAFRRAVEDLRQAHREHTSPVIRSRVLDQLATYKDEPISEEAKAAYAKIGGFELERKLEDFAQRFANFFGPGAMMAERCAHLTQMALRKDFKALFKSDEANPAAQQLLRDGIAALNTNLDLFAANAKLLKANPEFPFGQLPDFEQALCDRATAGDRAGRNLNAAESVTVFLEALDRCANVGLGGLIRDTVSDARGLSSSEKTQVVSELTSQLLREDAATLAPIQLQCLQASRNGNAVPEATLAPARPVVENKCTEILNREVERQRGKEKLVALLAPTKDAKAMALAGVPLSAYRSMGGLDAERKLDDFAARFEYFAKPVGDAITRFVEMTKADLRMCANQVYLDSERTGRTGTPAEMELRARIRSLCASLDLFALNCLGRPSSEIGMPQVFHQALLAMANGRSVAEPAPTDSKGVADFFVKVLDESATCGIASYVKVVLEEAKPFISTMKIELQPDFVANLVARLAADTPKELIDFQKESERLFASGRPVSAEIADAALSVVRRMRNDLLTEDGHGDLARELASEAQAKDLIAKARRRGVDLRKAVTCYFGVDELPDEGDDQIDRRLRTLSLSQLKLAIAYVELGMDKADAQIAERIAGKGDSGVSKHPFLDALCDGTLKPEEVNPVSLWLLTASKLAEVGGDDTIGAFFTPAEDPPPHDVIEALYAMYMDLTSGKGSVDGNVFVGTAAGVHGIIAKAKKNNDGSLWSMVRRARSNTGHDALRFPGFGTGDIGSIVVMLRRCGVDLSSFGAADVDVRAKTMERILALMAMAKMDGYRIDELPECIERCMGQSADKVDFASVCAFLKSRKEDPNAVLFRTLFETKNSAVVRAVRALGGIDDLSDANLTEKEFGDLWRAQADLAAGSGVRSVDVKVKGVALKLVRRADGVLNVEGGPNSGIKLRAAYDLPGLRNALRRAIVASAKSLGATPGGRKLLLDALPTPESVKQGGGVQLARAFCRQVICALQPKISPLQLSFVPMEKLYAFAKTAIQGGKIEDLPEAKPSQRYNSQAMVEMRERSVADVVATARKVNIRVESKPPVGVVNGPAPTTARMKDMVADLFLNENIWTYDALVGKGEAGGVARLKSLLNIYRDECAQLRLLQSEEIDLDLPKFADGMDKDVKDLLLEFAALADEGVGDLDGKLAAFEKRIDALANRIVGEIQGKVTKTFSAPRVVEALQDWQLSLRDLGVNVDGFDKSTPSGAILLKTLANYFVDSAMIDKRAMLSSFLRNVRGNATDGLQVAEALKGAGPLLQKMLQSLPPEIFNAETQLALRDMKSRLRPIPEEAVKAQLLDLIDSSDGEILSIDVLKSLGAASVGQAFLCNVKTKERPVTGVDCVIKLIRPNVEAAMQRERQVIEKAIGAEEIGDGIPASVLKASFEGNYKNILKEIDLAIEAQNVVKGVRVYMNPKVMGAPRSDLKSMRLLDGVSANEGCMIVTKAPGETVDGYIKRTKAAFHEQVESLVDGGKLAGGEYEVKDLATFSKARVGLTKLVEDARKRREAAVAMLQAWFGNALFGDGFFHADLHAGNIMTDKNALTLIDFGNCQQLSKQDRESLMFLSIDCLTSDKDAALRHLPGLILRPEARDRFSNDGPLKQKIASLFAKGGAEDMMARLHAMLTILQSAGYEVSAEAYGFLQSYTRMRATISGMDHLIEEMTSCIQTIRVSSEWRQALDVQLAKAKGANGSKLLESCYGKLAALAGDKFTTPSSDEVYRASGVYRDFVHSEADFRRDLEMLCNTPERAEEFLVPLIGILKGTGDCGSAFHKDFLPAMEAAVETLRNGQSDEQAKADARATLLDGFKAIDNRFSTYGDEPDASICVKFRKQPNAEKQLAMSAPVPMVKAFGISDSALQGGLALSDIKSLLSNKNIYKFSESYFGDLNLGFFAFTKDLVLAEKILVLAFKLTDIGNRFVADEERLEKVEVQLQKTNSRRKAADRLTEIRCWQIDRIVTEDFRSPTVDSLTGGFGTHDFKLLIDVVRFNLKRLRDNLGELNPADIEHAFVRFFSLFENGQLVKGLKDFLEAAKTPPQGADPNEWRDVVCALDAIANGV